jgi:hypothetical protein
MLRLKAARAVDSRSLRWASLSCNIWNMSYSLQGRDGTIHGAKRRSLTAASLNREKAGGMASKSCRLDFPSFSRGIHSSGHLRAENTGPNVDHEDGDPGSHTDDAYRKVRMDEVETMTMKRINPFPHAYPVTISSPDFNQKVSHTHTQSHFFFDTHAKNWHELEQGMHFFFVQIHLCLRRRNDIACPLQRKSIHFSLP